MDLISKTLLNNLRGTQSQGNASAQSADGTVNLEMKHFFKFHALDALLVSP